MPVSLSRSSPQPAPIARAVTMIAVLIGFPGCATLPKPTIEQKQIGMVYVLPGVEGPSLLNKNIAKGLKLGGVAGGVTIYDWTTGTGPLGWYVHLASTDRNRDQAAKLARKIIKHLEVYRDRPVSIVAHSGGAGIALMAVEMLPNTHPIDTLVLLGAAVSPDHNLTRALSRTNRGVWNFFSKRDIGFLVVGTSLFGTVDRRYGPSAGAVGFRVPEGLSPQATQQYANKLHQVPYSRSMAADGNTGRHNGWTHREFVANWLAPIINGTHVPVLVPATPRIAASAWPQ